MCAICHGLFDQFNLGTRQESELMFDQWLEKTERMLNLKDDKVF
ncbi:hypothetical protein J540_3233 [Acinetobacter baumannii 1440422]|nr:hypothetical protein J540_3785 [Acinetobacter baumannii 1440422]EXB44529.1 hypothetical protein J540_3233 [Acinetobacter baumannii 1440422]